MDDDWGYPYIFGNLQLGNKRSSFNDKSLGAMAHHPARLGKSPGRRCQRHTSPLKAPAAARWAHSAHAEHPGTSRKAEECHKESGWWFFATPLKNMISSIGMIVPNIWENKKWSKPPTRNFGSFHRIRFFLRPRMNVPAKTKSYAFWIGNCCLKKNTRMSVKQCHHPQVYYNPYAQCMECLPTCALRITPM